MQTILNIICGVAVVVGGFLFFAVFAQKVILNSLWWRAFRTRSQILLSIVMAALGLLFVLVGLVILYDL